ncbi:MAG TPA: hypothetical protein ENN14_00325 [Chloroflexi bacterium]|nr:hypothetical protein [Chloroflexota bacterium]
MEKLGSIVVDFFAHGYRVSGNYKARQRPLGDAIYDNTTSYLMVEDAYFSTVTKPADITASYPVATIVKQNLSLALTGNTDDALRRDQKYGSYLGLKLIPVFITLSAFELKGSLRIPGRLDVRVILSTQTETFITLVDVTVRSTYKTDVTFTGGAALVNKTHIGFMGLQSL